MTSNTASHPSDRLTASPRLFDNPLLDRFSRTHPYTPLVYLPLVAGLLWWSFDRTGGMATLGWALFGYLVWTLCEYWGHRILFHWEFPGEWGARIHFLMHGVHHDHPQDPLRLVMPLIMSGPIMLAAWGLIWLAANDAKTPSILAGFMAGYVAYDMVHYLLHHAEPRTPVGRALRRIHMLHHFRDHTTGYGVSAPWWDTVFRTAYRRAD